MPVKLIKYNEHDQQCAIVEYVRRLAHPARDHLVAIPNAAKRTFKLMSYLKREGFATGFPDLFMFYPTGQYHGAALENKRPGNKPTSEQREWLTRLEKQGYFVGVAYSIEEGIDFFELYLSLTVKKDHPA